MYTVISKITQTHQEKQAKSILTGSTDNTGQLEAVYFLAAI